MPLPLFQVDAFGEKPFSGNPAAVSLPTGAAEEKWMGRGRIVLAGERLRLAPEAVTVLRGEPA